MASKPPQTTHDFPVATYQPYWVLRAHLGMDRADALARALALTADPAARGLLIERWGDG